MNTFVILGVLALALLVRPLTSEPCPVCIAGWILLGFLHPAFWLIGAALILNAVFGGILQRLG